MGNVWVGKLIGACENEVPSSSVITGLISFPQALSVLDSMPSSKQYSEFQEPLAQARQFISYPGHCLQDGNHLLALLINSLYPEVHYLDIIR